MQKGFRGITRAWRRPFGGQGEDCITVLFLVDTLNIDGVTTHALSLAQQLKKRGHRVIIGTGGGPLTTIFETEGLDVVNLPFGGREKGLGWRVRLFTLVKRLVLSEQVDIVHAHFHSLEGIEVAHRISKELNVPLVATIHGLVYSVSQIRKVIGLCDHVIAVSNPVYRWLTTELERPAYQISVVPNGIDVDRFCPSERQNGFRDELGLQDEKRLVVVCGRLAWAKSRVATVVLETTGYLSNKYACHFAIVGGGPDASFIRALANVTNRNCGKDIVSMVGWRMDPVDAYRAADVVIGTARVALEAMSCGRPVIAAGSAGYVGLIRQELYVEAWETHLGDHQRLFPVSPERFRSDLEWVFQHPEMAELIGERGRRWVVDNFSIDRIAGQTEKIYRAILEQTPMPAQLPVQTTISPQLHELHERDLSDKVSERFAQPHLLRRFKGLVSGLIGAGK